MNSTLEQYQAKHPRSAELYQQSKALFPDGVTHDSRYMTPFPLTVTHASGPLKWDVDGNEYIDYVMGHGALLLGHSHPEIVAAITEQAARGTHLGANHELEQKWARLIQSLIPSAEKVRFTLSGTETTLLSLRLARAYTKREGIIKFSGHFHGWHDFLLPDSGRSGGGISTGAASSTRVLPPNDIEIVEATLQQDKDIAAVILEPTGANAGAFPLAPDFLHQLREVTQRHNVLLIFDEVVTGFRVSSGGAQARYDVMPDLTALGKILGGGLPSGAVVGRGEILDMISHREDPELDRKERVAHPGTFNANPISAAAGSRCLELVATGEPNARADAAAEQLRRELNTLLARMEVPGCCYGVASQFHLRLGRPCLCGHQGACTASHAEIRAGMPPSMAGHLKRAMLNAGVDLMVGTMGMVSATHTNEVVDRTLGAFQEALETMREEGIL